MQLPRSITSLLLIAATVSGAALPSAEPEAAPVAATEPSTLEARQGLDLTWACSVPAGYVYDTARSVLTTCGSGLRTQYRLRWPANNVFSCDPYVYGLTHDLVQNNLNVCNPSGFAYSYRLKAPVNGLWACSIPPGWTYSATQNNLNVCAVNNFALSYRLAK